jgi:folate-binding protein YgfZ
VDTTALSDHELLTERAAIVARPGRAQFVVTGSEAAEFLQGQVTNDVEALAPGEGCYAAFLNPKGKLRCDVRILRVGDELWLDAEEIARPVVRWVLERFALGQDVRHEDVTDTRALLSVVGPGARAALDAAPPAGEHAHVAGAHGRYAATDLGVDVFTADPAAARAALALPEASAEAAEVVRIESGRPRLGLDMGSETIPEEAGLNERAVSFEKGCYVGQETVARLHYRGKPNRRLRGLRLSAPAAHGDEIALGDKPVGTIGSAAVSPRIGPIALALVRREAGPGDTVTVGEAGARAEVVDLPFAADRR